MHVVDYLRGRFALVACSVVFVWALLLAGPAHAQNDTLNDTPEPFGLSVGFRLGIPLDVGAEVSWDIISYVRVRVAAGYHSDGITLSEGNALLNGGTGIRRDVPWVMAYGDVYPFQKELLGDRLPYLTNIRFTFGLGWYGDSFTKHTDKEPGSTFSPGEESYSIGDEGLEIDLSVSNGWPVHPYVGIGFETNRQQGFVFGSDIGVAFVGSPEVEYTLDWHGKPPTSSDANEAANEEADKLASSIEGSDGADWKWWRFLASFNLGWHF